MLALARARAVYKIAAQSLRAALQLQLLGSEQRSQYAGAHLSVAAQRYRVLRGLT